MMPTTTPPMNFSNLLEQQTDCSRYDLTQDEKDISELSGALFLLEGIIIINSLGCTIFRWL
jgi:hypothetical protein